MYYECRHIMPNGARCHSPALRKMHFCYFHARLHRLTNAPSATPADGEPLRLPLLEDRSAIQVALSQIFNALGSASIDTKTAGLFLYGLQIASQNVERRQDILPFKAVESVTHTRDGDELAPELLVYETSDNDPTCDHQETCTHFDPAEASS